MKTYYTILAITCTALSVISLVKRDLDGARFDILLAMLFLLHAKTEGGQQR